MEEFIEYLKNENKSINTIKGYLADIKDYFAWFEDSFSKEFSLLMRQNVLDQQQGS